MEEDWPTLVPQTGYKYAGTRLQSSLPCDQPLLPLFHMRNAPRPRDEARKSTHASGSGSFARPPPPPSRAYLLYVPHRTAPRCNPVLGNRVETALAYERAEAWSGARVLCSCSVSHRPRSNPALFCSSTAQQPYREIKTLQRSQHLHPRSSIRRVSLIE